MKKTAFISKATLTGTNWVKVMEEKVIYAAAIDLLFTVVNELAAGTSAPDVEFAILVQICPGGSFVELRHFADQSELSAVLPSLLPAGAGWFGKVGRVPVEAFQVFARLGAAGSVPIAVNARIVTTE